MKKMLFLFFLTIIWAIITPFLVISFSGKEEFSYDVSSESPREISYEVSSESPREISYEVSNESLREISYEVSNEVSGEISSKDPFLQYVSTQEKRQ